MKEEKKPDQCYKFKFIRNAQFFLSFFSHTKNFGKKVKMLAKNLVKGVSFVKRGYRLNL